MTNDSALLEPDRYAGVMPDTEADRTTPADQSTTDRSVALRVATMPRDTNPYGTIFGGVILSYIDQAGFVHARRHGVHRWVTVSIDRVDFKAPVHLGDIVTLYTRDRRLGTSSLTVCVEVEAERYTDRSTVPVTTAIITLVSVDEHGKPIPFRQPPTVKTKL